MKNSKLRLLSATLLACVLGLITAVSQAQNFPSKTIRVIEPAGPGSAVDTAVRDIIPALNEVFGLFRRAQFFGLVFRRHRRN